MLICVRSELGFGVYTTFQSINGIFRFTERYEAGVDLTEAMEQAPHREEVLGRFPVIGIFIME